MAGKRVARKSVAAQIAGGHGRSEEHTSELQSQSNLVCRLLLEKKKKKTKRRDSKGPSCALKCVAEPTLWAWIMLLWPRGAFCGKTFRVSKQSDVLYSGTVIFMI